MSSFDEVERRSKLAVVPKSINHGKVVKLGPKTLKTEKEIRTVLPEEQYLQNLEKIIVKDYFPELPKLKAQAEYIDAKERNDIAKMRELQVRYNTTTTDRRTSPSFSKPSPTGSESPEEELDPSAPGPSRKRDASPLPFANEEGDNERDVQKKKKKTLASLTVDKYLSKFTSEDNASFEELSALADRREKAKNAWLYEAAEQHNKEKVVQHAIAAAADVQLALRYHDEARPKALDNWTYKARNSVLFNPDGAALTDEEKAELARKNQTEINKTGTRFAQEVKNKPSTAVMARAAMYQAANNVGRVDVMGHEAEFNSKSLGVLVTPSPAPGVEDSPFMTWGSIDGTPFRLDAPDSIDTLDGAPAFKIPEVPYREQIAQGIHEAIAERYRNKRKTALVNAERAHRTPSFGSARSTEKIAMLTPAARKLVTNKLGIRLSTGAKSAAVTPITPSSRASSRTPGTGQSIGAKTPISSMIKRPNRTPTKSAEPSLASLTDNLMPTRQSDSTEPKKTGRATAGDFF